MHKCYYSSLELRSFLTLKRDRRKKLPEDVLTNVASNKKTDSGSKPISILKLLHSNFRLGYHFTFKDIIITNIIKISDLLLKAHPAECTWTQISWVMWRLLLHKIHQSAQAFRIVPYKCKQTPLPWSLLVPALKSLNFDTICFIK